MKAWLIALVVVLLAAAVFAGRSLSMSVDHRADVAATPEMVTRGAYLTRAADCMVCHTRAGGAAYAGGREFDLGAMGKLYTPNITPDKATGIGDWTDDDFRSAMQLGIGRGHKFLYPAFPYASYTLISDADVLAIKAYLFSLAPVSATPPPNAMRFPFNQRFLMAFWNTLFNPRARLLADASQSPEWNRGRYLVEGLGHCGECHTPRNLLQARKSSAAYAGAIAQKWHAYNISSDKQTGIGGWSDAALFDYLSTGHADGHGSASGPMAEVVQHSLQFLEPSDIRAMIVYLRSVAARPASEAGVRVAQQSSTGEDLAYGKSLYVGICANCHRLDGSGAQTPYQTLTGASTLRDARVANLMQVVLHGSSITTPAGENKMPAFASGYRDSELAAVINYATHQLAGREAGLSAADIAAQR